MLQQSTHESEIVVAPWAAELIVVGPVISVVDELGIPVIERPLVDVIAAHSTLTSSSLKMEHHGREFREPAATA